MGKIKSAWEIALEKTEDIVVDENKIRHNQKINSIRRAAGTFLISDSPDESKLKEDLSNYNADELKEALTLNIINGLVLPSDIVSDDRFDRLKVLLSIISKNGNSIELFDRIVELLKQYPQHKNQLTDQMKAQFEPMLREKEAQMKEQYGQEVHLNLEEDKEFLQVARQNLEKLEGQYQQTLDGAKEQLKMLIG